MTLSSSPYAVFKAKEWASDIPQPIGIGQCLRLTPKKFAPIRSSIKKKSGNTLRKRLSKTHIQLAFAWHVNFTIIKATNIAEQFCRVMYILVLFLVGIIWFHFVSSLYFNERDRLLYRCSLKLWIDQLLTKVPIPSLVSIWTL